jgi:transposase InsO family protein
MVSAKDEAYRFAIRRQLVRDALEKGIKPTARAWGCSRNTVRKWLRRYQAEGLAGLKERSHAPKSCPHKTSPALERRIVKLRKKTHQGARRLVQEHDLPCSHNAVHRIIQEHGLVKKRRTRRVKKNDLRRVKAQLRAFELVQMDVKYLTDLAPYAPAIKQAGCPTHQYTIRDVRTGALFMGFADGLSKTAACIAIERFLRHLKALGVDPSSVTIQTDNGTEFDGTMVHRSDAGFTATLERYGADHRFIPPGCSNANADVETVHNLIEQEFFDLEDFRSRRDFFEKAGTWQGYFNISRPNSYQGWRTPRERLQEADSKIDPRVLLLPPMDLDRLKALTPERRPGNHTDWVFDGEDRRTLHQLAARASPSPGGQHQPGHPGQA